MGSTIKQISPPTFITERHFPIVIIEAHIHRRGLRWAYMSFTLTTAEYSITQLEGILNTISGPFPWLIPWAGANR